MVKVLIGVTCVVIAHAIGSVIFDSGIDIELLAADTILFLNGYFFCWFTRN